MLCFRGDLMKILNLFLFTAIIALSACKYEFRDIGDLEYPALQVGHKTCVIGDVGADNEGQALTAKALKQQGCDHVRIVGDIIYPNGIKDENDPMVDSHFLNYYSPLMNDGMQFFLTMGNHDHRGNTDAWMLVADRVDGLNFPNYFYFERYGDICHLSFDSNIVHVSEQVDWAKTKLTQLDDCRFVFSYAHHPYKSAGSHGDASFFIRAFLKKYIIGKMDAHFAGHDHHLSYEGISQGTELFVSGGGNSLRSVDQLEPPLFSASRLGFLVLTYQGDHFEYQFVSPAESARSQQAVIEVETLFEGRIDPKVSQARASEN